jgi:hypothetical protein
MQASAADARDTQGGRGGGGEEDVEWWHRWRENRVELDPLTKRARALGLQLPPGMALIYI